MSKPIRLSKPYAPRFLKYGLLLFVCLTACHKSSSGSVGSVFDNSNTPDITIELIGVTISGQTDEAATVWIFGGSADSDGLVDTDFSLEQITGIQTYNINASTQYVMSETISVLDVEGNQRDYGMDIQMQRQ